MRRLFGSLLILHAAAHAGAGVWVTGVHPGRTVTLLWFIATAGFLIAGIGLLGVERVDRHWRLIANIASIASMGLLALYAHPVLMVGAAIDGAILIASIPFVRDSLVRQIGVPAHPAHRHLSTLGTGVAVCFIVYVAGMILLRPWHTRWGLSEVDVATVLPGDESATMARYRVDHGLTIHAPADSVWPWLAQIGQDRAGFYSYDWLERLAGDPIRNADRIVPGWQTIKQGDFVRAAPPDYLGGMFGPNLGWRVRQVVPGRLLVLDGWGSFVLQPLNDSTTRIVAHTRGEGTPSFLSVTLSPLNLLVFEPAHFVMERRMLKGIKERAERRLNDGKRPS
jgi:hypothetical protein